MDEIQRINDLTINKWSKILQFIHHYPLFVKKHKYPQGFKIPNFSFFNSKLSVSLLEYITWFTAQCRDVNHDNHKLRLFNFSLTSVAFLWYIHLSSNLEQTWDDMVRKFHEQLPWARMEVLVSALARMTQTLDESPTWPLYWFKVAKHRCRVPLPEANYIWIAQNNLNMKFQKKCLGMNFHDMYDLAEQVEQYDSLSRKRLP